MTRKILILGINGFIGSNLVEKILAQHMDWELHGLDLSDHNLKPFLGNPRLHFKQGNMCEEQSWIEEQIKTCDIVLPLVAIATPATYVQDPLRIFELDFEANLPIIRACVTHKKRIIFPSTSEVYGMSSDVEFNEETSNLVLGPIHKERWIYSCSKQLMDRIIYAYGQHNNLDFTLFRPFNWIGPRQDNIFSTKDGSSRVLTQFISNIIHGKDIQLVDGGKQQRCFTYIDDGISALIKIIANENNCAKGRIFNIGNPENNYSIAALADLTLNQIKNYPKYAEIASKANIINTAAQNYYGSGYQDVNARVPSIANAKQYLGWQPLTNMQTAIKNTLDYYFLEGK